MSKNNSDNDGKINDSHAQGRASPSSSLKSRLNFIIETDKLKGVERKTSPIGMNGIRRENSAEHCWQAALTALTLIDHANNKNVDINKVIKMLLLHDIVEVDVGDNFHYNKENIEDLNQKEDLAAQRLFGMLPEAQAKEYIEIWREFEEKKTPESIYAAGVDRLVAVICNTNNNGGTMAEFDIPAELAIEKNRDIQNMSEEVWEEAKARILTWNAEFYSANSPIKKD